MNNIYRIKIGKGETTWISLSTAITPYLGSTGKLNMVKVSEADSLFGSKSFHHSENIELTGSINKLDNFVDNYIAAFLNDVSSDTDEILVRICFYTYDYEKASLIMDRIANKFDDVIRIHPGYGLSDDEDYHITTARMEVKQEYLVQVISGIMHNIHEDIMPKSNPKSMEILDKEEYHD